MIGYTDEIHKARADCLMFFILIECGWGRTRRLPSGEGNRNSIAYRSKVDLSHQGGWLHFRTRRGFKYMAPELLPRPQERKRAREEMKEAEAILNEMRERIFEKMGVPPKFRRLA